MRLKMNAFFFPLLFLVPMAIFALFLSAYVVHETEQVIITQFGEIEGDPVNKAGLHFKLPFVQKVNRIEKLWIKCRNIFFRENEEWVKRIGDKIRFFLDFKFHI